MKLVLIFYLLIASAFASYDKSRYGYEKIGKPYKIGRSKYYPKYYRSYQKKGYISWYGPKFHGKKTANGAIFNQNSYTVAHKTLQLPSVVEVTNLNNGKKVIAVVNDRGPFSETQSRILDASKRVAIDLDFINKGVIKGRVKLLVKETKLLLRGKKVKLGPVGKSNNSYYTSEAYTSKPVELKSDIDLNTNDLILEEESGIYVQIGAFKDGDNTDRVVKKLEEADIVKILIIQKKDNFNDNIEVVRVGPLFDSDAENMLTKIKDLGYYNARILTLD